MALQVFEEWRKTLIDANVLILIGLPLTILLHNVACFGFWCGMAVLSCYLAGMYCCSSLERQWWSSSSLLFFTQMLCNELDVSASNHVASRTETATHPHDRVVASRSVDRALDQIFCRIADQYISTWYNHISKDACFQFEVRSALRRIVCSLYDRIARVNLEHFLLEKMVPVCLAHAIDAQKQVEISRLHVAVHSRKSEVMYVQNLSKCVLKFLLPAYDLNCRSYAILLREIVSKSVILSLSDAICNPCVLNQLILRHLEMKGNSWINKVDCDDKNNSEIDCNTPDKPIPLLQNFVSVYETNPNNGCLRPDLNAVLKDKELQNTFMRYLKSHNAEHVLQFCLDIASFNEKILKPELEAEELDDLYRDAWDLFSVYFSSYSPNCIHFPKDLASPLRKALSKDILKLRTTATLFEAYEYAFSILENRCQDFHNSAEFYRWLYGRSDSHNSTVNESAISSSLSPMVQCVAAKDSFGRKTIAEIGQKFSKIKDALKADSVLDGHFCEGGGDAANEAQGYRYIEVGVDVQLAPVAAKKKISNWRITIPTVGPRLDPVTNSVYTVFVMRIVDKTDEDEWSVERRPIHVHTLHAKLVRLYGSKTLRDLKPPRLKFEETSTAMAMEDAPVYEEYLKKLAGLYELHDSRLLHSFFTSIEYDSGVDDDDHLMADAACEDDDRGQIEDSSQEDDDDDANEDYENEETNLSEIFCKAVVPTLRKERGQNLETFVNSLINLCVTNKSECKDVVGEKKSANKKTNFGYKSNLVYGNNFDVDTNRTRETILASKSGAASFPNRACPTPFALVIHAAYKIYNLRTQLTRILVCFKCTFGKFIDQLIFKMTRSRLKQIAVERKVVSFINTIEWAVFDNRINYSEHRVAERVTNLLTAMSDNWLFSAYQLIFQTLQDAQKNKQLFYKLCDVLMEELFPEIFPLSHAYAGVNE